MIRSALVALMVLPAFNLLAQGNCRLVGVVVDEDHHPISFVQVTDSSTGQSLTATDNGRFSLNSPMGKPLLLTFRRLGFQPTNVHLSLPMASEYTLPVRMTHLTAGLPEIRIRENSLKNGNFYTLDPSLRLSSVSPSGSFESALKSFPGVSSTSELSSQYAVRGGNYDENLVYVQDFPIFRPFLVQQGQQEGLSFIHSDLVSAVKFSTGGFGAEYGDKMSSVLDVTYKTPIREEKNATIGFLGASFSYARGSQASQWTFLASARYRSNQFLLRTLDVQGNYRPAYADGQSLITYQYSPKTSFTFLGYVARNRYALTPTTRQTVFGTLADLRQLTVAFEGNETYGYTAGQVGIKAVYQPSPQVSLQWLASVYHGAESQKKLIQGNYLLANLFVDPSGKGKTIPGEARGIGQYGEFADSRLSFEAYRVDHTARATLELAAAAHSVSWGLSAEHDRMRTLIQELTYTDTLSKAAPDAPPVVMVQDSFFHPTNLSNNRFAAFAVDRFYLTDRLHLELGFRLSYLSRNAEWLKSPRLILAYAPWKDKDLVFRFTYGLYYQRAVYNEFYSYDGTLSPKRPSQRSEQYIVSADWKFPSLGRLFTLSSALYYKALNHLIPYEINDVKIAYLGNQSAEGYAAGLDLRLSGQFVDGLESSLSVSIQKTEQRIADYFTPMGIPIGYLPRPTDQRINIALFFQDKLIGDPLSKVHLSLIYGSNLPLGPPDHQPYLDVFRAPAYRRVDLGFSRELIAEKKRTGLFHGWRSLVVYAEVFNILNIDNTISYFWIRDIGGNRLAIPNYLTTRIINLKFIASF